MILAEKVLKLRKESGMSQEELAEKLNVSRQSVSKWESATAYPELNKILDLASLFGVTTDYLLKDDAEQPAYTGKEESRCRHVSLQEANEYLETKAAHVRRHAISAALFVLSPVPVVLLNGAAQAHMIPLSEDVAGGIGTVLLLLFVVIGCIVSIGAASLMKPFDYLKYDDFELEYGVEGVVKERSEAAEHRRVVFRSISISLIILSVAPLILAGVLSAPEATLIFLSGLMLILIAAAVFLSIFSSAVSAGCKTLLEESGSAESDDRAGREKSKKFYSIYWPIVVAVYLLLSFLTKQWDNTWVVWPVAALVGVGISRIWSKPGRR